MYIKPTVLIILCSWYLAQPTIAQNKKSNLVLIKSDPTGAMIHFKGESSFVGVAPFKLRANLHGGYEIFAHKEGFERKKFNYFFTGNENGTLKISLSPKTRFKAALRSSLFPGWGQLYAERKTSGVFLNLIQVGTIIGTLLAVDDYNKAVDEYKNALTNYELNRKLYSVRAEYWQIVVEKNKKANDSFDKQQMWLWAAGGIWIYNILDSIFFFPSFDKAIFNRSVPAISMNIRPGVANLALNIDL